MKRPILLGLALLLLTAGCKTAALRDDVRTELSFTFSPITLWKPDELHLPYVTGARVTVWLEDDANADMTGWRFESSAPEVLAVVTRDTGVGSMGGALTAGTAGTAELRALEPGGRVRYRFSIPVVAPDRVELAPHGPLLVGDTPAQAATADARILAGGSATFLVRYFAGSRLLHGNGALRVSPSAGLQAEARTSFLYEKQEWVTVTANRSGELSLGLAAGATGLPAFRVVGIAESELAGLALAGEDETQALDGESLNVVATGLDAAGRPVHGVACQWTLDGAAQRGADSTGWPWSEAPGSVGDLYRYQYRPSLTKALTANRGAHTTTATLHAGSGYVSSTNFVGCSLGGDDLGSLGGALLILAAALLVARRPRREDAPRRR